MCVLCINQHQIYDHHLVHEKFLYRHFEKDLHSHISQQEIYDMFLEYCKNAPTDIQLVAESQNKLGRYLVKIKGLNYYRGKGNARVWMGLKKREARVTGLLNNAQEKEMWEMWHPSEDRVKVEDDEKPHVGRPRKGAQRSWQEREPDDATIKGKRWSLLKYTYDHSDVIRDFDTRFLIRGKPEEVFQDRMAIWNKFDEFCHEKAIPTCSAIKLKSLLRVARQSEIEGGILLWHGLALKEMHA